MAKSNGPVHKGVFLASFAWVLTLALGFSLLNFYMEGSGKQVPAPSKVPTQGQRFKLLVFVHPFCPCTVSTVDELAKILPEIGSKTSVTIYAYSPSDSPNDPYWVHSSLLRTIRGLKGVQLVRDPYGKRCADYHCFTSGQMILYNPKGALVFQGGITAGRGDEMRSIGRDAIEDDVLGKPNSVKMTPVFGCYIIDPATTTPTQPFKTKI